MVGRHGDRGVGDVGMDLISTEGLRLAALVGDEGADLGVVGMDLISTEGLRPTMAAFTRPKFSAVGMDLISTEGLRLLCRYDRAGHYEAVGMDLISTEGLRRIRSRAAMIEAACRSEWT